MKLASKTMPSPGRARQYTAPALEKGLAILELLSRTGHPLSRAEIARSLNRSANELYRMLTVLEDCRYVRRDEISGKYELSLKLFRLGQGHRLIEALKAAAIGPMRAFAEEMKAECHLSILEEGRLVVIHQVCGTGPIRLMIEAGSVHSPLHTVSGRVLLEQMEPKERQDQMLLAERAFPKSPLKEKKKESSLRKNPANAVSWAKDETLVGLLDGAVAMEFGKGMHAALASSVFHTGLTRKRQAELGEALQKTAAAIRTELGAV